jgi:hypothetical protein
VPANEALTKICHRQNTALQCWGLLQYHSTKIYVEKFHVEPTEAGQKLGLRHPEDSENGWRPLTHGIEGRTDETSRRWRMGTFIQSYLPKILHSTSKCFFLLIMPLASS